MLHIQLEACAHRCDRMFRSCAAWLCAIADIQMGWQLIYNGQTQLDSKSYINEGATYKYSLSCLVVSASVHE